MPKYQNISDFRQSMVLAGNRVLLRPGDVVQSDRELREIFLERVEEDTVVTFTEGRYVREVDKLAAKVSELEKEKESLSVARTADVEENVGALQAAINDLRSDFKEDLEGIRETVRALKEFHQSQKEAIQTIREEQNKEQKVVDRRLGILKRAMMTMEEELYGPLEDSEGNE